MTNATLKFVKELLKKSFIRNVSVVAGGTAVAQIITLIFAPVLTRIYEPEAYGAQGVFLSVVGISAALGALTYPWAIVLPKDNSDAIDLGVFSIVLGLVTSVMLSLILLAFSSELLNLLNVQEISEYAYLIPAYTFLSIVSFVVLQLATREKSFRVIAYFAIAQSAITALAKTLFGLLIPTAATLIWITTITSCIGIVVAKYGLPKGSLNYINITNFRLPRFAKTIGVAGRFLDFPIYRAPQVLLNTFSNSIPIFFLASGLGTKEAGFFSIATSVLLLPATFLGNAVTTVFYPRISEAFRNKEDTTALMLKATAGMVLTGVLPFIIIGVWGTELFSLVFGASWSRSGLYAQILVPWLFLNYINRPAVAAIPVLGLQRGLLIYEIISTLLKVGGLYVGFFVIRADVVGIAIYSLIGSMSYIWLIFWVIRTSYLKRAKDNQ